MEILMVIYLQIYWFLPLRDPKRDTRRDGINIYTKKEKKYDLHPRILY